VAGSRTGGPSQPPGPSDPALSQGAASGGDPTRGSGSQAPTTTTTTPGATPTATGGGSTGGDTTLSSDGGSVVARCSGTEVFVVSWQEAAGYTVKKAEHGPKAQIQIMFDPVAQGKKVTMHVSCDGGVPTTKNT
jgi:serine/threonine-protein kinase